MNEAEQLRETIKKIECHIKTAKEKLSELEAEMKSEILTSCEKLLEEAQAQLSALEE